MHYITPLPQRDAPGMPGSGDPYTQDLERREFIRETAVRLLIMRRTANCQPGVAPDQAARCWADAEALWNARPWAD